MSQQGVTIGEGDVVLFHTGWTDAMLRVILSSGSPRSGYSIMTRPGIWRHLSRSL